MNIAFIPARGGSKGVPGKNIKDINGKPLIAWSIEQALASELIEDVYVSTDCPLIKDVAMAYGAKVPFFRPAEISGDKATTESSVLHFLEWAKSNSVEFDNVVLMQATSPFRYPGRLDSAIREFISSEADSLLTVTKTHRFIWKNPEKPQASYDVYNRPRRQDIKVDEEIYFENGSFYITKLKTYVELQNRLGGNVAMFEMNPEESFEIDDLLDFKLTEFMMKEYGIQ